MMVEEIIIDGVDGLGCNNCPEIGRCREQQKRKDSIINALLYALLDNNDERIISNLKGLIPKITRCDVVIERQLKRAEQKLERIKERLIAVSYLAPQSTRILKMDIENIIEGE